MKIEPKNTTIHQIPHRDPLAEFRPHLLDGQGRLDLSTALNQPGEHQIVKTSDGAIRKVEHGDARLEELSPEERSGSRDALQMHQLHRSLKEFEADA